MLIAGRCNALTSPATSLCCWSAAHTPASRDKTSDSSHLPSAFRANELTALTLARFHVIKVKEVWVGVGVGWGGMEGICLILSLKEKRTPSGCAIFFNLASLSFTQALDLFCCRQPLLYSDLVLF